MPAHRAWVCAVLGGLGALAPIGAQAQTTAPRPLVRSASFAQSTRRVTITVGLQRPWNAASERVCVDVRGRRGAIRVCTVHVRGRRVLVERVAASGVISARRRIAGVTDLGVDRVRFGADPADLRLAAGKIRWRLLPSEACRGETRCRRSRWRRFTIRRVVVDGCVRRPGPWQVRSGSPRGRRVALTFDDGPSTYTRAVLRILRAERVRATFFLLGENVRRLGRLARAELAAGNELGNHTWSHAAIGGGGSFAFLQLERTQNAIREATGVTPCLMRPPYGATGAGLAPVVRSLGVVSVLWSVDPRDWSLPGTGTIIARALAVRPGGIVLFHDGGGPRAETVAALRTVIRRLKARRYRFVTVSELLGLKPRYRLAGA